MLGFSAPYAGWRPKASRCAVSTKDVMSSMDRIVSPEIRLSERSWSTFSVCGYTGLILAVFLTMALGTSLGLSRWVMSGMMFCALWTFLGLAMITKIITGEENLTYYHHQMAILIMIAFLLKLLRQPILPYLDVTILGIGIFLSCGRMGCFMVGCCHGRPHRWGVCYGQEHVDKGFRPYLVDVRLFPIQVLESLWVLFIVIGGVALVLSKRYQAGDILAWYMVMYGLGRFCLEFLRGDPGRFYFLYFSEAQWTSFILMGTLVWAELSGILPYHSWHAVVAVGVLFFMSVAFLVRKLDRMEKCKLLHPDHVKEVAEAIETLSRRCRVHESIPVMRTSLGLQMSGHKIKKSGNAIDHYALSNKYGLLSDKRVKTLARLILQLRYPTCSIEVIKGNRGVFHLFFTPRRS